MITLLKIGYEKIMTNFYIDKNAKIHLREMARKTNLNENSVTRFLKQLEKDGILKSEKDGNLKKYSIQKNIKTFIIFSMFDIEKFDKLPSIRKNAIYYFIDKLKEKPIITILFGSTAKGNYAKNSDIDLLLILNKKIDTMEAERYAESQTNIKINCLQLAYPDFLIEIKTRQDNLIQSAIKSGYPITNNIEYYKEISK